MEKNYLTKEKWDLFVQRALRAQQTVDILIGSPEAIRTVTETPNPSPKNHQEGT